MVEKEGLGRKSMVERARHEVGNVAGMTEEAFGDCWYCYCRTLEEVVVKVVHEDLCKSRGVRTMNGSWLMNDLSANGFSRAWCLSGDILAPELRASTLDVLLVA